MELQILKKFRENDDPELLKVSGKSIETLSKDEIIVELEKLGINGVELCSLGAIDPRQENLAVLLHYAVEIKNAPSPGTSREPTDSEPPAKVQKTSHERSDVSLKVYSLFNYDNSRWRFKSFVYVLWYVLK